VIASNFAQNWVTKRSHLLMLCVFGVFSPLVAPAQPTAAPAQPPRTRPAQPPPATSARPSKQQMENFQQIMSRLSLPGKGCFAAHYPTPVWQPVTCGNAPKYPNPLARGLRPAIVGGGNDQFIQVAGQVSSATGSFDSATGISAEYGLILGNTSSVSPDVYSLQLNANRFSTVVCGGVSVCTGWQQFLFSQSQCNGACVFIEYWLLDYPSPCPAGNWIYYPGTATTAPGCFMNTTPTLLGPQPLADLSNLKLSGSVSNGADIVMLATGTGDISAASQDSILDLAQGWTGAEFNVFGDCCATEAYFNSGSTLTVRLSAANGTVDVPTCSSTFSGPTAETNNLNLVGSCSTAGGADPSILFSESGGGPLPPGTIIGPTSPSDLSAHAN
jgi:hypothetical protein